jgi:hypothetical protein
MKLTRQEFVYRRQDLVRFLGLIALATTSLPTAARARGGSAGCTVITVCLWAPNSMGLGLQRDAQRFPKSALLALARITQRIGHHAAAMLDIVIRAMQMAVQPQLGLRQQFVQ